MEDGDSPVVSSDARGGHLWAGLRLTCVRMRKKVIVRVVLGILQEHAERVYPESECRFSSERSTIDMIFSLRQPQEKYWKQGQPMHIAFIDLTKVFDLVSRDSLFKILDRIGCSWRLSSRFMRI